MIFHHSGILPCFCEGGIFLSAGDQALNLGKALETRKDIFVYVWQCTVTKKREGLGGPSDEVNYHVFCVYCKFDNCTCKLPDKNDEMMYIIRNEIFQLSE